MNETPVELGTLYQSLRPALYRKAVSLSIPLDQREDAIQQAFARAISEGSIFDMGEGDALRWLSTIIHNGVIDEWRRWKIIQWEPLSEGSDWIDPRSANPLDAVTQGEQQARIRACLPFLLPEYRRLLIWRYWEGVPTAKIAKMRGATLKSVRGKMERAQDAFKRIFQEGRVTLSEACAYLGKSGRMTRKYIEQGRLKAVYLGERGQYLILCSDLEEFAQTDPRRNKKRQEG